MLQISDWRRDHSWKPDDEAAAETYLAQRYVDNPYLVISRIRRGMLLIGLLATAGHRLPAWPLSS